ncbi:hypothetical protein MVEN_00041100 [Mycena venus]|uniref:DDE Tnp4 domain-containing protein n=1 Tax=Mycena venus TaxID=2733690 RepID=A0A8H6Z3V3_9AGAR|nr:hypothetical protein MVEN_00041100 [Mycena venus]
MDIDAFFVCQYLEDIQDDEMDEQLVPGTVMAIMTLGAIEAHRLRTERQQPSRLYLCCPQLPRNPRGTTSWQILYGSHNDRAFITTMGFDVATFDIILAAGFDDVWNTTPIPREDARGTGKTRPGARSLDTSGALGQLLHYLNSTMREISLQQIFALIPSTISRYITFGLGLLLQVLRRMPQARIKWPQENDERDDFAEYNALIVARHPLLDGAFTSDDMEIENATFNGWLSEHYISSVVSFAPKGNVIAAKINAPGSWHDSCIAQPIYEKLQTRTPDGFYLVADTVFPRGAKQIEGKIRAPIKTGQRMQGTTEEIEERLAFDRQLLSYRQTAEWGMRGLQGSFGRL